MDDGRPDRTTEIDAASDGPDQEGGFDWERLNPAAALRARRSRRDVGFARGASDSVATAKRLIDELLVLQRRADEKYLKLCDIAARGQIGKARDARRPKQVTAETTRAEADIVPVRREFEALRGRYNDRVAKIVAEINTHHKNVEKGCEGGEGVEQPATGDVAMQPHKYYPPLTDVAIGPGMDLQAAATDAYKQIASEVARIQGHYLLLNARIVQKDAQARDRSQPPAARDAAAKESRSLKAQVLASQYGDNELDQTAYHLARWNRTDQEVEHIALVTGVMPTGFVDLPPVELPYCKWVVEAAAAAPEGGRFNATQTRSGFAQLMGVWRATADGRSVLKGGRWWQALQQKDSEGYSEYHCQTWLGAARVFFTLWNQIQLTRKAHSSRPASPLQEFVPPPPGMFGQGGVAPGSDAKLPWYLRLKFIRLPTVAFGKLGPAFVGWLKSIGFTGFGRGQPCNCLPELRDLWVAVNELQRQAGQVVTGPLVAPPGPAPFQPAPFQPAPSQPAPSQPAPFQPAPVQPAPFQLGPAPFQPPAPEPAAPDQPPFDTAATGRRHVHFDPIDEELRRAEEKRRQQERLKKEGLGQDDGGPEPPVSIFDPDRREPGSLGRVGFDDDVPVPLPRAEGMPSDAFGQAERSPAGAVPESPVAPPTEQQKKKCEDVARLVEDPGHREEVLKSFPTERACRRAGLQYHPDVNHETCKGAANVAQQFVNNRCEDLAAAASAAAAAPQAGGARGASSVLCNVALAATVLAAAIFAPA